MSHYPDFADGQDNAAGLDDTRPIEEEPTTQLAPQAGAAPALPSYAEPPAADADPAPTYAGSAPGYGAPAPYGAATPSGIAPAPGYPYGGYQGHGYAAVEHPQTQIVFILGIVGIFTGIPAFVAWYLGAQARKEIQAGAPYRWDGNLKTGYLLGKVFGIISIVGAALAVVFFVLYVVLIVFLLGAGL